MKLTNIIESRKVRLVLLVLLTLALPAAVVLNQYSQNIEQHALSGSKMGFYFLNVDNLSATSTHMQLISACPKYIKVNDPQQHSSHATILREYKSRCSGGQTIMRVFDNTKQYNFGQDPTQAANDFFNGVLKPAIDRLGSNKQYVDYLTGPNEHDNHPYPFDNAAAYDWTNTFWLVLAQKINGEGLKPLIGQTGAFFDGGGIRLQHIAKLKTSLEYVRSVGGAWSVHPYTSKYSTNATTEAAESLYHRQVDTALRNAGIGSIPMIFGEAGFNGVNGGGGDPDDGWQNRPGGLAAAKQEYLNWLQWWDGQLRNDSYVLGVTLFQSGGTLAGQWTSFDIDPIACEIRQNIMGAGPCQGAQPPTNTPIPAQPTNTPVPGQPTNTPAPQGNTPPTGGLDVIDDQGRAFGHTHDPDIPTAQIQAHFFVDGPEGSGTYAGALVASQDFGNGKGAHSFIFTIPNNFRDGQTHQLYAYGLDYQGVRNGLLNGSPKPFNLRDSAPPDPTNPPPPNIGGTNPNPNQDPPPKPRNLDVTCNLANRTAKLEWDSGGSNPGTDLYYLHVRGQTTLDVRVYPTYYTLPIELGKTYTWWVEAVNHKGPNYDFPQNNGSVGGPNVKCAYPPLPTQPPAQQPTATPQPGAGVCANGNYECICRTTPRDNMSCLAQTAPWAVTQPQPGNSWNSCSSTPATCRPDLAGNQPPATGGIGTVIIEIKDKNTGNIIDARSGAVYISNVSSGDSDGFNLSGVTVQGDCSKIAPGRVKCENGPDTWYGGMSEDNVPDGYTIYDAGIIKGEDSPLTVQSGGTVTITVLLTQSSGGPGTGGPNPDFVPNCLNIQGPTTIKLGSKATYLAQFSGPNDGQLSGTINAVKTTNPNAKDSTKWEWVNEGNWPPKELGYTNGVLTYEWTPKEAGVYQVFCRAFNGNAGNAECRGPVNTVDGPPRYWCKGPGASLTVNVTSADANSPESQADMCEFATTIGGNVMQLGEGNNSKGPLLITAIAKAGVNVKTYTFSFYNLENTADNPKPIFFEQNTPYVINSSTNSVTVPEDVFTKPDLNNGGKTANNILINAYFTDSNGTQSLPDPKCSITIQAANPTPTPVPTNTPAPTPPPGGGPGAIIATMGVLIIAVIVSLNFFFH